MITVTSTWQPGVNDFRDVAVRRLHGDLLDKKSTADNACRKMEELIQQGKYDISLNEIVQMLKFDLQELGFTDLDSFI